MVLACIPIIELRILALGEAIICPGHRAGIKTQPFDPKVPTLFNMQVLPKDFLDSNERSLRHSSVQFRQLPSKQI